MVLRNWLLLMTVLLIAGSAAASDFDPTDMRLLRNPDIHGDTVVFVQGGDLWTVPAAGGNARRLTSHVGFESQPKFSPDGRWIAFSGDYDGNNDVYVVPAGGGEPRRLTWHPLHDRVIDWEPDGKSVRFQTSRSSFHMREQQLWTVPLEGGLPTEMILPSGGLSSWSPDGKRLAYNRITREQRTWKRYKGGMAQNIWIYDFAADNTLQVTDWPGTENFPMWHGDTIYFTSDRTDKLQIWAYDVPTGAFRQVTRHKEYDVKNPSLGPDSIVYENGGWLWVLDLATEKSRRVKVELNDDRFLTRPHWASVSDHITDSAPGPDAKRVVFSAHGDIFTVPAEKGEVRNLTSTPGINEIRPAWSPDGKLVAYYSDRGGEYELHVRPGDGTGEEKRLTKGNETYYFGLLWSPDSEKILTYDAEMNLRWVDAEGGEQHHISQGNARRTFDASWSPDSRWVAYAEQEANGFRSIFLHDTEKGETTRVTSSFTDEDAPAFDREGKYLFFTSQRIFNPRFAGFDRTPFWTDTQGLYLVTLQADAERPFPFESDEVSVDQDDEEKDDEEKEDAEEGDDEDEEEGEDDSQDKATVIDLEGLGARLVALDVEPGRYWGLECAADKLYYMSRRAGAEDSAIMLFDMEEREAKTVLDNADGFDLSADGQKILYASKDSYGLVDAAADQKPSDKPLRIAEMRARVEPRAEWRQNFVDAWRLEGDFFYDPGLHGVDWQAMRDRYGQLVPYITDRRDLDYVLGELIAELGAGHAYVRPGGDRPTPERVGVGLLGCDFELDAAAGRYRLTGILTERDWNKNQRTPLFGPGLDIDEGDYLLAVDGVDLAPPGNPYALFEGKVDKQVALTVAAAPDGETREVVVRPIDADVPLRYVRWVERNRRLVAEMTDNRVGYLHLPDTAFDGAQAFAQAYYPQTRMEGLVIDERYNGGGFIPDFFLNVLNQKFLNMWKPRHGQNWRTPDTAFNGPMVMVSNAHAGSGGDALPYYFKRWEIGKVVGMRTWGGLVGYATYVGLMGGGHVTFPEFGLYDLDGEWDVENHGVDPDIEVDNLPHLVIQGRDPQLEKAVDVILQELKQREKLPDAPRYPRDR
ncbi:PDZ domain-containing protein [bacterium]|nr:PDZ domain-containing protein [bacterium]MBU1073631.1 PDZ domain-containing protein [bacterium]